MVASLRLAEAACRSGSRNRLSGKVLRVLSRDGAGLPRGKVEDAGGPGREDRNEAAETGTGFKTGTFQ